MESAKLIQRALRTTLEDNRLVDESSLSSSSDATDPTVPYEKLSLDDIAEEVEGTAKSDKDEECSKSSAAEPAEVIETEKQAKHSQ